MVMNKHSYLSTRLVDLNNIKMYTVDKQYMNVQELFYLIGVILMFSFLT